MAMPRLCVRGTLSRHAHVLGQGSQPTACAQWPLAGAQVLLDMPARQGDLLYVCVCVSSCVYVRPTKRVRTQRVLCSRGEEKACTTRCVVLPCQTRAHMHALRVRACPDIPKHVGQLAQDTLLARHAELCSLLGMPAC